MMRAYLRYKGVCHDSETDPLDAPLTLTYHCKYINKVVLLLKVWAVES